MPALQDSMLEYRAQLRKGSIQVAYKGLMEYLMALRTHFQNRHPEFQVPGNVYFGYMDMTYFSIMPEALKGRKLKIAVVFLHEAFRFEVWLSAVNRQVLADYWQIIKESGWDKYRLVPSLKGMDSCLEYVLVENPDFNDLDGLTAQIERGTLRFIADVEAFLAAPTSFS